MKKTIPEGRLFVIGGAEDKGDGKLRMATHNTKFVHMEILRKLVSRKFRNPRIEVVTTATDDPESQMRRYKSAFEKVGYKNVGFINIQKKVEAKDKKFLDRVKKAKTILFAGGDQFKIATILAGTEFTEAIRKKYLNDKDFTVAGTSAGAAVISEVMIQEGGTYEALFEDDLKTGGGLGLIGGCIIDTHFIRRGRFSRLAHAVIRNPGHYGIGLGEDSAIMIKKGHFAKCTGSGMVVIIDGSNIEETNIDEADETLPVYVDNLKVHLLVKDCKFDIKSGKVKFPRKKRKSGK